MSRFSHVFLNYNRTWNDVGAIVTAREGGKETGKPIGWVRDAFKDAAADKVHLGPGAPRGAPIQLYKFNNYPCLTAPAGPLGEEAMAVSEWWSPYESYDHVWSRESGLRGMTNDPGFFERVRMAAHFGVNIREWARLTSVIKENWNGLGYLLIVTLKVNAYGWFGRFASMGRIDKGGATKALAGEGSARASAGANLKKNFTSAGMMERMAMYGTRGTLPGGAGTQFYIPNLKAYHIASWRIVDLSTM